MITLHHLRHSRSHRIIWLLEELKLPYELKIYDRDAVSHRAPPELAEIHPLGKAPIIVDETPDGPITIAESSAIVEYVITRYGEGRLAPAANDWAARAAYGEWLDYAEGSAMGPMLILLLGKLGGGLPAMLKAFAGNGVAKAAGYLSRALEGRDYLVGEITGADIQMSYVIEMMRMVEVLIDYPVLAAYMARLEARPAYQAALEKGGPVAISV